MSFALWGSANGISLYAQKINLKFDEVSIDSTICEFTFPAKESLELTKLKQRYDLESIVKNDKKEIDKAISILAWTHSRWKHDGNNVPEKYDPLYILEQADKGERYRCVEYSIVLSAVCNAIGLPSRVIGIKKKDVETNKYGAGHIVSETYMPALNKWIFMDAQMNYIPFLNDIPLNAVEYRKAIQMNSENIELRNKQGVISKRKARKLIKWVMPYLYYFDAPFDASQKREKCNGKSRVMLVPVDAKKPKKFQVYTPLDYLIYTYNVRDFYKTPIKNSEK
ncbi:transglutaminase-like domain-containing protein [Flavobacteriaceae bacterium S356]|uniref:Transglutaminase-like domain-containing protein n=1 Tax=Asprobacillus argus TaxID=3076534 RepID=A0ABU3LCY5_9FLAO|nr:transglutaminase-like domain-containing protein [Flavobacteriaceae bacterium S356]